MKKPNNLPLSIIPSSWAPIPPVNVNTRTFCKSEKLYHTETFRFTRGGGGRVPTSSHSSPAAHTRGPERGLSDARVIAPKLPSTNNVEEDKFFFFYRLGMEKKETISIWLIGT